MSDLAAPAPASLAPARHPDAGRAWLWFLGLLLLAAAIRAWLIFTPAGHQDDLDIFVAWIRRLQSTGLTGFYASNQWCDYPPLMVLVFDAVGRAATLIFGPNAGSTDLWIIWKTPACLADLLIGFMLMLEGRRLFSPRAGLVAAALYLLNPVSIYDSAYWGQVDAIYTGFLLAALLLIGRGRWLGVGVAAAVALLTKFQAIALLPLLILETYRLGGWRGIALKLGGAAVAAAVILAPFHQTGTLSAVLTRSYVQVVGQYQELSKNAFNVWWLSGAPESSDTGIPRAIVAAVAGGQPSVAVDASPLLWLTWRHISLIVYTLVVAIVLSLYSLRPGSIGRYRTAGVLALAFFLFPTEMHERYAFPAVAFLAIWALARPANERFFLLLCGLVLVNFAAALDPAPLGAITAAGLLAAFGVLAFAGLGAPQAPASAPAIPIADPTPAGPRRLIPAFRLATIAGILGTAGLAGYVASVVLGANPAPARDSAIYLGDLAPRTARQGWKTLARDRNVDGANLRLGNRIYLRGLGTHAPARLEYDIPKNARRFAAVVGVHRHARLGSVTVAVEVDGKSVMRSELLTPDSTPLTVDVPVAGARRIALIATDGGNGRKGDHVDWALARFVTTE